MIGNEFLFQWDFVKPSVSVLDADQPRQPKIGDIVHIEGPPKNISVGQVLIQMHNDGPVQSITFTISVSRKSKEGSDLLEWLKGGNDVAVRVANEVDLASAD